MRRRARSASAFPRAALLASLLLASARASSGSPPSSAGADDRPRAPRPSARPAQHRTSALRFSHAELDPALARSKDRARRRVLLGEAEENATPDDPASAYATHPLHGSVREHGYYYADVALGVPPRTFQVIVDTGSTLTYVPCASCGAACGRHTGAPPYDPEASATHEPVDCRSDACVHGRCSRDGSRRCVYNRGYAEHSSVEGHVVKDVIHLGGDLGNLTVAFGCTTRETGGIHDQVADGLMGLGHGADALPAQIAASRGSPDAFSLCYGSFEGGGAITLGRLPPGGEAVPALAYTPLVPNPAHPGYYVVETETWAFERFAGGGDAGETVAIAAGGDFSAGYGTVLDSGTTFTYAPTKVFDAFVATLDGLVGVDENDGDGGRPRLERVPGPDPNYPGDVCYKKKTQANDDSSAPLSTSTLEESFPRLALAFGGGASLSVPPSNYLFAHGRTEGAFCLGVMDNGDAGTLVGGITTRDVLVEYDLAAYSAEGGANDAGRVGLAVADCDAVLRNHGPDSGRAVRPPGDAGANGDDEDPGGDEGAKGDGGEAPAEAPSADDENDADENGADENDAEAPTEAPSEAPSEPTEAEAPAPAPGGAFDYEYEYEDADPEGAAKNAAEREAEAGRSERGADDDANDDANDDFETAAAGSSSGFASRSAPSWFVALVAMFAFVAGATWIARRASSGGGGGGYSALFSPAAGSSFDGFGFEPSAMGPGEVPGMRASASGGTSGGVPGSAAEMARRVAERARDAAERGNEMFRASWNEIKARAGAPPRVGYAKFGLDDDRRPRRGAVELPPLLRRT